MLVGAEKESSDDKTGRSFLVFGDLDDPVERVILALRGRESGAEKIGGLRVALPG